MDTILEAIQPYFDQYGYMIVLVMSMLENAAFVGAVVPGDVVLLLAGFYAQRGELDLPPIWALAFGGALVGDTIGYLIGRLAGRRIVDRWGGRLLPVDRIARVDRYFKEYGILAVAFGRLTPIVRTVNTFAAGMAKMPFPAFIAAVASTASVWAVAVSTLGFLFSGSLEAVRSTLGWFGVAIFVLFVAALYLTYRRMADRLAAEALRMRRVDGEERL